MELKNCKLAYELCHFCQHLRNTSTKSCRALKSIIGIRLTKHKEYRRYALFFNLDIDEYIFKIEINMDRHAR